MKKIILLLTAFFLAISVVSAFDAVRTVTGNNVEISVDIIDTTGFIVDEVLPVDIIPSSIGQGGVYSSIVKTIRWTKSDNSVTTLTYSYTGSGTINGTITGGNPASQKAITGDTQIGITPSIPEIKINEFVSDPDGVGAEWIELYNPTGTSVDLTGWTIEDNTASQVSLTGKNIPALGYLVLEKTTDFSFALNNDGDVILLKKGIDEVDNVAYGNYNDGNMGDNAPVAINGKSTGRLPNGIDTNVDADDFEVFSIPTKNSENVYLSDTTAPEISNINVTPSYTIATIIWMTNENSDSTVYYGLTTALGSEESKTNLVINHNIPLTGLTQDTEYYYKVESCDASDNCVESEINNFTTLTTPGVPGDDLMINYIRGKIIIEGENATAGTEFRVLVLTGANAGNEYLGEVDENVPSSLQGNGYFDTLDQIAFSTGESFRVEGMIEGFNCSAEGTFENGGNGRFEPEAGLITLICNLPNNPPILSHIGNKEVAEQGLLEFTINASDLDLDSLDYSANNLPTGATFNTLTRTFSWTPGYNASGIYPNVEFVVDDGQDQDSETITITVTNVNHAPVMDTILNQQINEDTPDTFTVSSSDLDFDSLTYSIIDEDVNEVDCEVSGTTVTMTPALNWNGNAICEVQVSDGILTDSQVVDIEVTAINNAPEFIGKFQNITIDEDECYELDLLNSLGYGYFFDSDSNLNFNVSGNFNIPINIVAGVANICPEHDWFGIRSIFFTATDEEFSVDSNAITINVNDLGEPPIIYPITAIIIDEDSGTDDSTTLTAIDTDGTIDRYEIVDENTAKVNCNINGDTLEVTPALNFNGDTECVVRVYDNDEMHAETSVEIHVNPVNDAPTIVNYNPTGNPRLLEGWTQAFSITTQDADGDALSTSWELDNIEVDTDNNYLFDSSIFGIGSYALNVSVTDGVFSASKLWSIVVGNIEDFTCSEVGGDICSEKEICSNGDILGVYDTSSCCSVSCSKRPPEFGDIDDRCELKNQSLEITISNPDDNDKIMLGEDVEFKFKVKNNADEKVRFDVETYLYDLTNEEIVDGDHDSVKIDGGKSKTLIFDFTIPDDLDGDDDYAFFVRVVDDSNEGYCNEDYVLVDIEREEDDVIISNLNVDSNNVVCDDYILVDVTVENIGNDDKEVYVSIKNQLLGISETSEEFELEGYGGKDKKKLNFIVKIPENAIEGDYVLDATVFFNSGERFTKTVGISVGECKKIEVTSSIGQISLNSQSQEVAIGEGESILLTLIVISLGALVVISFLVYLVFKAW